MSETNQIRKITDEEYDAFYDDFDGGETTIEVNNLKFTFNRWVSAITILQQFNIIEDADLYLIEGDNLTRVDNKKILFKDGDRFITGQLSQSDMYRVKRILIN